MGLAALFPGTWWLYLAGAVVIAAASGGATYEVKDAFDQSTIKDLKLTASNQALVDANAALKQFTSQVTVIQAASAGFQQQQEEISSGFAQLSKDFRLAAAARPLPVDCKPDPGRVSALRSALDKANTAPGSSSGQSGSALPTTPAPGR